MAKKIYSEVGGTSRNVPSFYTDVNNKSRKVTKGYVEVDGKARMFYLYSAPIVPDPEPDTPEVPDTPVTPVVITKEWYYDGYYRNELADVGNFSYTDGFYYGGDDDSEDGGSATLNITNDEYGVFDTKVMKIDVSAGDYDARNQAWFAGKIDFTNIKSITIEFTLINHFEVSANGHINNFDFIITPQRYLSYDDNGNFSNKDALVRVAPWKQRFKTKETATLDCSSITGQAYLRILFGSNLISTLQISKITAYYNN